MSPLGLGVAAATALIDQAHKAWMLYIYDIGAKGLVTIAPFFDLVLVWNQGISYGLLPQASAQELADLSQDRVGGVVAVDLVDPLEAVNANDED